MKFQNNEGSITKHVYLKKNGGNIWGEQLFTNIGASCFKWGKDSIHDDPKFRKLLKVRSKEITSKI